MTPEQIFQNRHGAEWAATCQKPVLTDALIAISSRIFEEIAGLSLEFIASTAGNAMLAKWQGWILHERALLDLSVLKPAGGNDLEATYADETEEALASADEQDQQTSGSLREWLKPSIPPEIPKPTPKPKQKRKRRKRRKQNAT